MEWVERYQQLNNRDKEEFTRILNRLLANTFLTRRDEESRKDFYFVDRHLSLFNGYLTLLGWEIILDRVYGVCQILHPQGSHRLSLNLMESILLLILRLLYEEKRKQLNITNDVVALVREVQEQYLALKIRTRPLEKKLLRDTFNLFKRFQLVEPLDREITDPDCRFIIYPTILFAVKMEGIQEVHSQLEKYREGGNDEDETVDTDQAG